MLHRRRIPGTRAGLLPKLKDSWAIWVQLQVDLIEQAVSKGRAMFVTRLLELNSMVLHSRALSFDRDRLSLGPKCAEQQFRVPVCRALICSCQKEPTIRHA
jgi:hypothetical protein